jgi:hypothetical protein
MKNIWLACLLGIASIAAVVGCDPSKTASVEVVSVDVHDWTSPTDGKTYVVAAPTWRNNGPGIVRTVMMVASFRKADGTLETLFEPKKPLYYGSDVEKGTEVKPVREPEDVLILGEKEALTKKYGELTKENVVVEAIGSEEKYEEEKENQP